MIYKLITFKLSFESIFRLLYVFMASNEDPNMKARRARTFLYFIFLIFYFYLGSQPGCIINRKLEQAPTILSHIIQRPSALLGLDPTQLLWLEMTLFSKKASHRIEKHSAKTYILLK